MADDHHDTGALFEAEMSENLSSDSFGVTEFDFLKSTTEGHYPYPKTIQESDAYSPPGNTYTYFSDTSRQPSPFLYTIDSLKQVNPAGFEESTRKRKTHGPPPKERIKCEWPNCDASVARKSDLRRHVNAMHLPEQSYKCEVKGCNRTFYRRDKFQDHERHAHKPQVHSFEKESTTAISQDHCDADCLSFVPKNHVLTSANSSHLVWTWEDDPICRVFGSDTITSTSVTEYSCDPSEDITAPQKDEFSTKGTISTRSERSDRTSSRKNAKEIHSADQPKETSYDKVRLACPYRKQNPVRYNIHSHKTCATSFWSSAPRIVEHLLRHHKAPPQCTRCWECFSTEKELFAHRRIMNICESRPELLAEGITAAVEDRLKRRKRRDQSETEKWKEIFVILFPKEKEIPTPYFMSIGDDIARREYLRTIPKLFLTPPDFVHSNQVQSMPPKASLREELPRLFKSRLEAALARDTLPALSEIVDMVTECCDDFLAKNSIANLTAGGGGGGVHTPPFTEYTLPAGPTTTAHSVLDIDMEMSNLVSENSEMNSYYTMDFTELD